MKNTVIQKVGQFLRRHVKLLLTWIVITVTIVIGFAFGLDKKLIAVFVLLFGTIGHAFTGLAALIAVVPVVGPIIVKVLALPVFWLLNALGYFVSVVAIKLGYRREVVNYRIMTIVFLIGIICGYVLGRLF